MRNTAGVCGSDDTWSNGGQDAELGEALMSPAHRPHMLNQLVSLISVGWMGNLQDPDQRRGLEGPLGPGELPELRPPPLQLPHVAPRPSIPASRPLPLLSP